MTPQHYMECWQRGFIRRVGCVRVCRVRCSDLCGRNHLVNLGKTFRL